LSDLRVFVAGICRILRYGHQQHWDLWTGRQGDGTTEHYTRHSCLSHVRVSWRGSTTQGHFSL